MKKLYLLVLVMVFVSCKKDRDVEFSTFTIEDEKFIPSYTSVDLSCKVRCAATINELYLQYATNANFSKCEEVRMTKGTSSYSVKVENLIVNTTYYVRYLAVNSYSSMISETVSKFKTQTEPEVPEYVDLGLSVKWATCNIGAKRPEDYGDYFAWGEVKSKAQYSWNTYKYYNNNYGNMMEYFDTQDGVGGLAGTFGRTSLEAKDDVATIKKGDLWRIPTDSELNELRNNCVWILTIQKGVNGYKVEGKNGNSIFLPAAGYMDGSSLEGAGADGCYWSKSLRRGDKTVDNKKAESVCFNSSSVDLAYSYRYYGFSVRPIYYGNSDNLENNQYTITMSSNDSSYGVGGTYDEGNSIRSY